MAVQYVGNTLRIPICSEGDMDKPFGSSVLEREVRRIVVNPFSDSSQAFVPEEENAKLCELLLRSYESFEDVYDRCDIDDSWRMETALEDMRVCMRGLGVTVDD